MIRIILSLMFLTCTLFPQDYTIDAEYKIYYGVLGSIGEVSANLKVEKGTYKIKLKAKAKGLAKVLSRNREETYESTGIVKSGKFIPNIFISSKKRGSKTDIRRYLFNYDKKTIYLLKTRIRDDEMIDTKSILPYFAEDDIMTLFFNLKNYLGKDLAVKDGQKLAAAGANEKNGKIDLYSINEKEQKNIAQILKNSDHLLSVVLNQRIFASEKGEMIINLNEDGICTSALLKDVVMFGDIRGEIMSLNIKKQEKN